MSEVLSDYEKQRLDNIARNQKVLIALGLVRSDAEKHEELRAGNAPKAKRQKDFRKADIGNQFWLCSG